MQVRAHSIIQMISAETAGVEQVTLILQKDQEILGDWNYLHVNVVLELSTIVVCEKEIFVKYIKLFFLPSILFSMPRHWSNG